MRLNRSTGIFISLITLILIPVPALADIPNELKTYITWGEFQVVVTTFEKIALIMKDSSYKGLFASAAVVSIMSFGLMGFVRNLRDPQAGWSWIQYFMMLALGTMIYNSFIKPTVTITVYDETLNQQKTITDVPEGLAFLAGVTNKIEKGLVDIIWTASDPRSYRQSAGGSVFEMIKATFSGGVNLANSSTGGGIYFQDSLENYLTDCVLYEINRPGSQININDFYTTTDFRSILSQAQHPEKYTKWKDLTHRGGTCVSCTEAWTRINSYLSTLTTTSPEVQQFFKEKCSECLLSKVFGASGPLPENVCRNKVVAFLSNEILGSSIAANQIVIQSIIANEMYDLVNKGDSKAIANRQTGIALTGMGMMANEWIPIIRGVVFAIFVGLFPFLCLFIVTPLYSRALSFIVGSFVFLISWGIADALIHSFTMDQAVSLFEEVGNGGLGLKSMLLFEEQASKSLALFGAARWASMMIAGVVSSMLVRFGGQAMAHFASQMSAPRVHGASAEQIVQSPDVKSQKISGLETAIPVQALANENGFEAMSQVKDLDIRASTGTNQRIIQDIGGGDVQKAAGRQAHARSVEAGKSVGRGEAVSNASDGVGVGRTQGEMEIVAAHGDQVLLDKYGPGALQQEHVLNRERYGIGTNYVKSAAANVLFGDGTIKYRDLAALNSLSQTSSGEQIISENGRGLFISKLTGKTADNVNSLASKSGFENFHAMPGDSVTMDFGYGKNGFYISNISARKMADRTSGEQESEYNNVKNAVSGRQSTTYDNYSHVLSGNNTSRYKDFVNMMGGEHEVAYDNHKHTISGDETHLFDDYTSLNAGVFTQKSAVQSALFNKFYEHQNRLGVKDPTASALNLTTRYMATFNGAREAGSMLSLWRNPEALSSIYFVGKSEGIGKEELKVAIDVLDSSLFTHERANSGIDPITDGATAIYRGIFNQGETSPYERIN